MKNEQEHGRQRHAGVATEREREREREGDQVIDIAHQFDRSKAKTSAQSENDMRNTHIQQIEANE